MSLYLFKHDIAVAVIFPTAITAHLDVEVIADDVDGENIADARLEGQVDQIYYGMVRIVMDSLITNASRDFYVDTFVLIRCQGSICIWNQQDADGAVLVGNGNPFCLGWAGEIPQDMRVFLSAIAYQLKFTHIHVRRIHVISALLAGDGEGAVEAGGIAPITIFRASPEIEILNNDFFIIEIVHLELESTEQMTKMELHAAISFQMIDLIGQHEIGHIPPITL